MGIEEHLRKAKELHQKAKEELERAREEKDNTFLQDSCAKGWLSALEGLNALLLKKGVEEEELPKTDRGRRYMVYRYAGRELEHLYFYLRDVLHIEGYYEGALDPEEVERHLGNVAAFLQKIEVES